MKSQLRILGGRPPHHQEPCFFGRIFYSSREYVYSNCLSAKQLDFFEKNVKTDSKMEFCPKNKNPLFLPIFTNFFVFGGGDLCQKPKQTFRAIVCLCLIDDCRIPPFCIKSLRRKNIQMKSQLRILGGKEPFPPHQEPCFFGRFWPHFLFLQRICLFELSFCETTRFF